MVERGGVYWLSTGNICDCTPTASYNIHINCEVFATTTNKDVIKLQTLFF